MLTFRKPLVLATECVDSATRGMEPGPMADLERGDTGEDSDPRQVPLGSLITYRRENADSCFFLSLSLAAVPGGLHRLASRF